MANEVTNFNIGGVDHQVKDPNAYVKPLGGIPMSDLADTVQTAIESGGSSPVDLSSVFGKVAYDSSTHRVNFYAPDDTEMTTVIGYFDASPFIVDGMVSSVEVTDVNLGGTRDLTRCLVITFNTDAGKNDINIPLTQIFNSANYYTKTEIDNAGYLTSHQDISGKVDKVNGKGLSTEDYTTAEKTKLSGIADGAEVNVQSDWNQSSSSADDYIKNKPAFATINGSRIDQGGNLTVQGEKGDKGDTGNVAITGDGSNIVSLIVNDLTTGGGGNIMSAEMGLVLRREITKVNTSLTRLYTKLANMAFWDSTDQADAEPTALNFNVPQKSVTFDLTGVGGHVIVKLDNYSIISPMPVDVGSTHTLTIEAATDYALNNDVAVEVDGVVQTLTESGGVYSLEVTVNANMAIEVVGTATQEWFTVPKSDVTEGGNVTLYGAQQGRTIVANGGYMTAGLDTNNIPQVIAAPAGYKESVKLYTTPYVEGSYNNSNPGKTTANYFATGGKRYLNIKLIDPAEASGDTYHIGAGCYGSGVIGNSAANAGGTSTIAGFKARIGYKTPDSTTAEGVHVWKIDLPTESSSTGIEYVKLIMFKKVNGTTTDSRNWFANATIKYKFSDD